MTSRASKERRPKLLSISDAAAKGIERLRKPIWAHPMDHIKIDLIGDKPGPWLHLYCPFNKECNGRDPVDQLIVMHGASAYTDRVFVPYTGPLPDSDEYKAAVAVFDGCLGERKRA